MRIFIIIGINLLISYAAFAQTNFQERYERGKDFYKNKQYALALEEFTVCARIDERNNFSEYASYYYALSKYQLGQKNEARDMLLQIINKFPKWDQQQEVIYWLAVIDFEEGKIQAALDKLAQIKNPKLKQDVKQLKSAQLVQIDSIKYLKNLLEVYPYDTTIAEVIAYKSLQLPIIERNIDLLNFIQNEFGLKAEMVGKLPDETPVFKDSYKVAVMLPLMLKQLEGSTRKKSNQFVLEIANGLRLAEAELKKEGVNIQLYFFDTERDSTVTAKLLAKEEMKGFDLIIGPLYPKPIQLVSEFSMKNKIVMINPVSTNSSVIGANPYSLLYRSTAETQAKAAAQYAIRNFENKNAFIVYSFNDRDLIFAEVYAEELVKNGFKINWYHAVHDAADARMVLDNLTEVIEEKDEDDREKVVMYNQKKVRVGEGDSLKLSRDSIGHIMLSSRDPLLVTNTLSGLQSRNDSIPILGFDEWLEIDQLSIGQLQNINIKMLAYNFMEINTYFFNELKRKYVKMNGTLPTQFSFHGFEMMYFLGKTMHQYGANFKNSLHNAGHVKGKLYAGFNYSTTNDNSVMPIVELQNYEMVLAKEKTEIE